MHYRIRMAACMMAALLLNAAAVPAAENLSPDVLSLEKAVAVALAANPGLAAIEARAKALAEMAPQVDALPDPSLSLNVVNLPVDSYAFDQEGMTQVQIGISQALPYPGKLALRAEAATHEAKAAEADVEEKRQQLIRDVKTLWWNIFYLDRGLDVVARNQVLLQQFVSVAKTRYRVGKGLQQDILLAQLEVSKLRDSQIRIQNMRDNEVARLNVLLDRPAATDIRLPGVIDERLPKVMTEAALQQRAEDARPNLTAQQGRLRAAQSRVDLAKKDYAPDFKLAAVYGVRDGVNADGSERADLASIMFSMSLPLYAGSKQDRAVDQRHAEWLQTRFQLQEQRNQVAAEVRQALSDYRHSREQVDLFQLEIIPQARQTVDTMLAGYQVDRVDFLSLIRSQTTLYDYETQYWKALSAANQALARLAAAVGEEKIYE